jgi:hypothetical protein
MKLDRSMTPYDWFIIAVLLIVAGIGVVVYVTNPDCTHGVLQPDCIWPAPGGF